jgi:CheY-like chemotaxis protein
LAATLEKVIGSPIQRPRIAVVDDEPAYVGASMLVLGDDYDVVPCGDAAELIGRLESGERFDLILADVNMPAMSGFQLFGRLGELRVVGKPSIGDELRTLVLEKLAIRRAR